MSCCKPFENPSQLTQQKILFCQLLNESFWTIYEISKFITTPSIANQLWNEHSITVFIWDVPCQIWKVHDLKIESVSFIEEFGMEFVISDFYIQVQIMRLCHSVITGQSKLLEIDLIITSSIIPSLLRHNKSSICRKQCLLFRVSNSLFLNFVNNHLYSKAKRNKFAKKGAQSVPIGIPMTCLNKESPQTT